MPLYTFMPVKKEGKPLFLLQVKKKKLSLKLTLDYLPLTTFL